LTCKASRFDYSKPTSLEEALRLKRSTTGSRFIAGGTDLMVQIKNRTAQPPALISLRSIRELTAIDVNGATCIGSMAPLTDLIEHPAIRERYPVLVEAVRRMGSVQIRNVATLGGNLCNASPAADGAPPLLVLDAKLRLLGEQGCRDVPLADYFVGPGETTQGRDEILTAILLEPPEPAARAVFLRKDRVHMDLAMVNVAVLLAMEADGETCRMARVAAGAVAPTPLRLREVESLLEGQELTPELLGRAQEVAREGVAPITDVRASAEYRRHITGVFVRRSIEILLGWRSA
jgi:aerobic carbon-monoxide dehydrogenase medium subunit